MSLHEEYFDNPDMLQAFSLFDDYHLTLVSFNEMTEKIVLQLITPDFLKKHFRETIKKIAPHKFSDSKVDLLSNIMFYAPEIDIFELDMVDGVLTDKEQTLLKIELYQISECDIIANLLAKPMLSQREAKLLQEYVMEMENYPEWDFIKDEVFRYTKYYFFIKTLY